MNLVLVRIPGRMPLEPPAVFHWPLSPWERARTTGWRSCGPATPIALPMRPGPGGCRVNPDRGTLTVWIPDDQFPQCLNNLRSNGRIAVTFARPIDYRAVQLKGRVTDIRPCSDTGASLVQRYRQRFFDNLVAIGIERDGCERLASSGCTAVSFNVTELYQQTPDPGAGDPLGGKP